MHACRHTYILCIRRYKYHTHTKTYHMHACICPCVQKCVHIHQHRHKYTSHTNTWLHACMDTYIYAHTDIHAHMHTKVRTHMCMHENMHAFLHAHSTLNTCKLTHTHMNSHIHTYVHKQILQWTPLRRGDTFPSNKNACTKQACTSFAYCFRLYRQAYVSLGSPLQQRSKPLSIIESRSCSMPDK